MNKPKNNKFINASKLTVAGILGGVLGAVLNQFFNCPNLYGLFWIFILVVISFFSCYAYYLFLE